MQNEENAYKTDANAPAYKLVGETREEIRREALSMAEKLNDPVILGALMYRTVQERENANRLLKSILERIDAKFVQMDERIAKLEEKLKTEDRKLETEAAGEEILLPKQDEDILGLVRRKGHVCAEEVRKEFGYKGLNGASARLSKLYAMGLLQKQQVGRKVYYKMK